MKLRKRIAVFALASLLLCLSAGGTAHAESRQSYLFTETGRATYIPAVYEVEATWKNLEEYGTLNHAEDLFMDDRDQLYVADTENNRVLKMSAEGEILTVYTESGGVLFKKPKGIYVGEDGTVWIADSGNYRLVRLNEDGSDNEIFYRPESSLLEESFTFSPEKIAVSATGYIYVLKGSNLMKLDAGGDFRGYVGASEVGFSLGRFLMKLFATRSQLERTLKQEAASYTNFVVAEDGYIYGIQAGAKSGQIRKLNSVGTNVYPDGYYGFQIGYGDGTFKSTLLADIDVMENGILTVCDRNLGLLCQYDQDGQVLAVFGGNGTIQGTYQTPVSVVSDSRGRLYVLDYSTNVITVLAPTKFISLVHNAVSSYDAGYYAEAKDYWEQVLAIDNNYSLAHSGYGDVLYKEERYKEAMKEYKLGENKEGYSKSFSEYRHQLFRQYFGWIVLAVAVVLLGGWFGFVRLKKRVDTLSDKLEMGGRL